MSVRVFIDTANLFESLKPSRLNYAAYMQNVGECDTSIAYVARTVRAAYKFADFLKKYFEIVHTADQKDFTPTLQIDILKAVQPGDHVIIGSNDPTLIGLLKKLNKITEFVIVFARNIPKEFEEYAICQEITKEMLRDEETTTA